MRNTEKEYFIKVMVMNMMDNGRMVYAMDKDCYD